LHKLRYFKNTRYDEIIKHIKDKTGFDLDTLTVTTMTATPTTKRGGVYNSDTRSMEVTLLSTNSIDKFNIMINWLKEVVVHELTHYIQDCSNRFINMGNKTQTYLNCLQRNIEIQKI
jgi:hypothetical protein